MAEPITLARPYAKAVFQVAVESNDLAGWSQMLRQIALVCKDKRVAVLLSSPIITAEEQAEKLIGLFGDALTPAAQNVVKVLAYHGRLTLIAEIVELFEVLRAQQEKSVDAMVTTAFEVNDATVDALAAALTKSLNREVKLVANVDPSLIGGAIIRAGDTVIDSSVRGKLKKLAESINS
ncbi:MAG: F0F1 ATP synthase subunit delta [Proteobacteria bacterium]|nr:F0F1 ATP synthase subunit delta [Pseudomonadota bacterium]MDA1244937.1 F0F1 ATP synthase subunit delta [Pseudomonadota bacterium]